MANDEQAIDSISLTAGSYDVAKLDSAVKAAALETDPAKRALAIDDAAAKANRTQSKELPPAGFKYVNRKTTFNKGDVNEATVNERVLVADTEAEEDEPEYQTGPFAPQAVDELDEHPALTPLPDDHAADVAAPSQE